MTTAVALTVAGSDSGGGAGIQADIKTFQELKVFGCNVLTAITAQNTQTVTEVAAVTEHLVAAQLDAVLSDFPVKAVKTGMLYSREIILTVAPLLKKYKLPLVVDPVMIAKSGQSLLDPAAVLTLKEKLLPLAAVITPNIPEAEVLTGLSLKTPADFLRAARKLQQENIANIIIKGGHDEKSITATDYVFIGSKTYELSCPRLETRQTHGTGCTFSAALTAFLARGYDLLTAITEAKCFIQAAIAHPLNLGHGHGPTNHFAYQELTDKPELTMHEC